MIRITADQEKDLYEPACGPVDIDWKHLRRRAPGAACTFFTTACFYSPRALVQSANNRPVGNLPALAGQMGATYL
ncbi:MAG: hypothetical protein QOE55_7254 [Acidobacteriaceae bacterium]|jgi:hypothetical protein|nr:hypothetical protein [Acidobacteriaceae bacterium]